MIKLLAALAVLVFAVPCRAAEACDPQWIHASAAAVPAQRLAEHLARPSRSAAPMLFPVHGVSSWIGVVERGDSLRPVCHASGSLAFYFIGPEENPQLDFVKTVAAGGEAKLTARLLELRWYDAKDGLRHSWTNAILADDIGWFTDGRGERGGPWPLAWPEAPGALH